jgi:hypothetical protein
MVLAQQTIPAEKFSARMIWCAMTVQGAAPRPLTPTHNPRAHANAEKKGTSSAAAPQK